MTTPKPDWQAQLKSLGLAGVIGYGIMSALTYTVTFISTWAAYAQTTGKDPAQDLLPLLGTVWLASRITQPLRIGGAVLLAGPIQYLLNRWQAWSKKAPSDTESS